MRSSRVETVYDSNKSSQYIRSVCNFTICGLPVLYIHTYVYVDMYGNRMLILIQFFYCFNIYFLALHWILHIAGQRNLVLRHSVLHFLLKSLIIALHAVYCFVTNKILNISFPRVGVEPNAQCLQLHVSASALELASPSKKDIMLHNRRMSVKKRSN